MTGSSPSRDLPDALVVGRVRRPHGVAGELVVEVLTDVAARFASGAELTLVPAQGRSRGVRVISSRPHRGGLLVRLEGVESRDLAEELRGARFEVARSAVPPPPAGAFYYFELVGCRCLDRSAGDLGRVSDLIEDGGGLLLEIEGRQRLLVPFVEAYLVRVDVEAGRIEMDLPDGLIEICASGS